METGERINCEIVHSIPGRLRLRVNDATVFNGRSERFVALLRGVRGVEDVRLNGDCQSVVVRYDAETAHVDALVEWLDELTAARLDELEQRDGTAADGASSWMPFGLSTAALVLGACESVLAPWLLAAAAVPILGRAMTSMAERRHLNVDVLDAAATAVLVARSQIPTAAVMVWLVNLGDVIRDITIAKSRRAVEDLFDGKGTEAWVLRDGRKIQVPVDEVAVGDEVVVYPGELVPVDGTVLRGRATVDQKVLTGESMPVGKVAGDAVYASSVVREGKLYLTATRIGAETAAAKVVALVRDAPMRETRIQNYAERFADRLVPWHFAGAGAALGLTGDVAKAAALLIVDYGTGIRVAAPTTVLSLMTKAARNGILIKGGRYLEQLSEVDAIVFDKTGTLTRGTPEVVEIVPYGRGVTQDEVLKLAAAAEQRLTHPVAEAVARAAQDRRLSVPERESSHYEIGLGVEANVNGTNVHVGSGRFMERCGISTAIARSDASAAAGGASLLYVASDGSVVGLLLYADPLRSEAADVIGALRDLGMGDLVMLTGDHAAATRHVARQLGLDRVVADAMPDQKSEVVRELQRAGRVVAVVGDGINDSPALAQADVGIAVRGGADVARETAHVALLEGNLWQIPAAIEIARESVGLIRENWNVLFYPNTVAIAASVLGWIGPIGATLISNGSAVAATLNGLRPLTTTVRPARR